MSLKNQTVFITGASRGIGRAIALRCARDGANVIIAAKSLIGFFGEGGETTINWSILISVSAFATIGIFIGMYLSKKIDGAKLKPIFGWFVLGMGIYIILKETVFK